jgi:hypothetical protein
MEATDSWQLLLNTDEGFINNSDFVLQEDYTERTRGHQTMLLTQQYYLAKVRNAVSACLSFSFDLE